MSCRKQTKYRVKITIMLLVFIFLIKLLARTNIFNKVNALSYNTLARLKKNFRRMVLNCKNVVN